jgi:hypothetical protein
VESLPSVTGVARLAWMIRSYDVVLVAQVNWKLLKLGSNSLNQNTRSHGWGAESSYHRTLARFSVISINIRVAFNKYFCDGSAPATTKRRFTSSVTASPHIIVAFFSVIALLHKFDVSFRYQSRKITAHNN